MLITADEDPSLALDRAYSNGTAVEEYLGQPAGSRYAALVAQFARDTTIGSVKEGVHKETSATPIPDKVYHWGSSVPPLPDNLHLDFDSRDAEGNFCAPEGTLRSELLSSTASQRVIVARGAASRMGNRTEVIGSAVRSSFVSGATGMAGVGKTTALIALGHDEAVRRHFRDGVLYLTLGAGASVKSITLGLATIMKFTGARKSAETALKKEKLAQAIEDAAIWFQGKCNLFLIDDVWPTESCVHGYLPELRSILQGSPESRIVLTSRNRLIGSFIGSLVDFSARQPHGPASTHIFMLHATAGCPTDLSMKIEGIAAVQDILKLCPILPIALAVTGSFVSSRQFGS